MNLRTLPNQDQRVIWRDVIIDKTQRLLDSYDLQTQLPSDVLRKLTNNYVMLFRLSRELGEYDTARKFGNRAIVMLGLVQNEEKSAGDFNKIGQIYGELAQMTSQNHHMSAAALFQFGSDFFSGKAQVSFSKFSNIVKAIQNEIDAEGDMHDDLMRLIQMIHSQHDCKLYPHNQMKTELSEHYYRVRMEQIIAEISEAQERILQSMYQEAFDILEAVKNEQVTAEAEVKLEKFEKPVRARVSIGGLYAPEKNVPTGRVAEIVAELDAFYNKLTQ